LSANGRLVIGLWVVLSGGLARLAWAADPLTVIPTDVYGVVAVRNPDEACRKIQKLRGAGDSSDCHRDLDVLAATLDLDAGVVDWSKPVVFVLTQPSLDFLAEPEFSETSAVLAFSPKDGGWYDSLGGEQQIGGTKRVVLGGRRYYATQRDGVVLLGGSRKAMRMLRGEVAAADSLASSLDEEQKTAYAGSDLFVHLPMRGWRERISFLSMLAANMVKLGMATEHDAQTLQMGAAVVNWAASGLGQILEQMESITLGVSLDGDTFRLMHYHRFKPGGSVVDYLGQVTRSKADLWPVLPDRPFYVLGVFDWQTPAELSVAVRFNQYLYESEFMSEGASPELRKKLRDTIVACYDQMSGGCLMITSPEGELLPIQLLGGYRMKDAQKGLEQLRFIQENARESFSGFLGSGHAGPFERRTYRDQEFFELQFDATKVNPKGQRQVEALYGTDICFQDAAIGSHCVVYSMSAPPGLVPEAIRVNGEGNHLGKNPRVQELRALLPPEPHGLIIVDLGRFLSAAPVLIQAGMKTKEAEVPPPVATAPGTSPTPEKKNRPMGPLLGWACVVHPRALSGHLAISVKDAAEAADCAQKMIGDLQKAVSRSSAGVGW